MSRKLQYFNVGGFGEAIRYILHYGHVEFEDIRHSHDAWPIQSVKDILPYGQMPLYEENGRYLNQSLAIARYVASQVGLLPSDPWDQAKLDAVALNVYDLINKLRPYIIEKDPQKKAELKKEADQSLEFFMSRFEKELKAGNGHFGGKLSWADFVFVAGLELMNNYLQDPAEKNYPTAQKLVSEIHSQPGVKAYVTKRGPYKKN